MVQFKLQQEKNNMKMIPFRLYDYYVEKTPFMWVRTAKRSSLSDTVIINREL